MSETTQTLTAKDGLSLFSRIWATPDSKAVIALIHGFGEHSGRYAHVADFFNKNGYSVFALDNRGHGQSGGKRGHAPTYDSYMNDIEVFLSYVATQSAGKPVFLYGHSMGGNLVLNYVIRRQPTLKGVIATGPWVLLAFEPKPILVTIGKLMRSIFPSFSQDSGLNQDHISKDTAVVEAYKNDPLVHGKITASASLSLLEAGEFLNNYAGEMPISTLIMHGDEDLLTSQPASEAFAKRVSGPVTYKKWKGMYHEIHNEPQQLEVFNYTLGWLERQS
jgi:alpha-beta hydrolase superfamily lysophospholipase